jgi:hypothetical protein
MSRPLSKSSWVIVRPQVTEAAASRVVPSSAPVRETARRKFEIECDCADDHARQRLVHAALDVRAGVDAGHGQARDGDVAAQRVDPWSSGRLLLALAVAAGM